MMSAASPPPDPATESKALAPGMRWLLLIAGVLVLLAGLQLFVFTERTATYFAWTHDVLRIVTFAEDKDLSYAQMKKWWNGAGPIR